jgi:hypothetical protein
MPIVAALNAQPYRASLQTIRLIQDDLALVAVDVDRYMDKIGKTLAHLLPPIRLPDRACTMAQVYSTASPLEIS